jgi:hypothetical protein
MKKLRLVIIVAATLIGSAATAQTATPNTYGARLANPADPTIGQNKRRVNSRINNRINSRIATRIEKYTATQPSVTLQRADTNATQAFEQAAAAVQQPAAEPE